MLLTEMPQEVLLSIIAVAKFENKDLLHLSLSCREWAVIALPALWKARDFKRRSDFDKFKQAILSSKILYPYGEYVQRLQIAELELEPPLFFDEEMIHFIADQCPNLNVLDLRFSSKPHANKTRHLPLHLLSDRLTSLKMIAYENNDTETDEDKDSDNKTNNSDALCECVKSLRIRDVSLTHPRITKPELWDVFARNSGESLEHIKLFLRNEEVESNGRVFNSSIIVEAIAKYCSNLRTFVFEPHNCARVSMTALLNLLTNCPKLTSLHINITSEGVTILHNSTSLVKVHISSPVEGKDLSQISRMESLCHLELSTIADGCDFKFLNQLPNLTYLEFGEFRQLTDDSISNIISHPRISELRIAKVPQVTDKHLLMLASMPTLVKLTFDQDIEHVTREGWLSLAKRPPDCPSWLKLDISDGRLMDSEFFELIEKGHPQLRSLSVKKLDRNLFNDDDKTFDSPKFKESWTECRNITTSGGFWWPPRKSGRSAHKSKLFGIGIS